MATQKMNMQHIDTSAAVDSIRHNRDNYRSGDFRYGYTEEFREKLKTAFKLVQDATHWKNPINKIVVIESEETLSLISESVSYFTASNCHIFSTGKPNEYHVVADGYFLTCGA